MRIAIAIFFLTLAIISLCEKPEFCGDEEIDFANELQLFNDCYPSYAECLMIRNLFWFRASFAFCEGGLSRFLNDDKFKCTLTTRNETLHQELECLIVVKYIENNPSFLLDLSIFCLGCVMIVMAIDIINRGLRCMTNLYFCFCLEEVEIVADCNVTRG